MKDAVVWLAVVVAELIVGKFVSSELALSVLPGLAAYAFWDKVGPFLLSWKWAVGLGYLVFVGGVFLVSAKYRQSHPDPLTQIHTDMEKGFDNLQQRLDRQPPASPQEIEVKPNAATPPLAPPVAPPASTPLPQLRPEPERSQPTIQPERTPPSTQPERTQQKLLASIDCMVTPLPKRIPPEPAGLYGVALFDNPYAPLGRYWTANADGGDTDWGYHGKSALMSYRCEVINESSEPLTALVLSLETVFREVLMDTSGGFRSGEVKSTRVFDVRLPSILRPNGDKFVFYIWNHSEFIVVSQFKTVGAASLLTDKPQTYRLVECVMAGAVDMAFNPFSF